MYFPWVFLIFWIHIPSLPVILTVSNYFNYISMLTILTFLTTVCKVLNGGVFLHYGIFILTQVKYLSAVPRSDKYLTHKAWLLRLVWSINVFINSVSVHWAQSAFVNEGGPSRGPSAGLMMPSIGRKRNTGREAAARCSTFGWLPVPSTLLHAPCRWNLKWGAKNKDSWGKTLPCLPPAIYLRHGSLPSLPPRLYSLWKWKCPERKINTSSWMNAAVAHSLFLFLSSPSSSHTQQTDSCRLLCSSTYLVVLFVRQRAFPTSNADPQTTSLARHFDL